MEVTRFDKNMMAVAFAEAGEHDTAREILKDGKKSKVTVPVPVKNKPYLKTVFFGAISITAYILLFKNEQLVTDTFTMGGWRWVFPVGAAFFFSFIHGAFASNLLSSLGLEAKK
ncbi:MAG: hypothetical protein NTY00_07715 [Deltaproteobacteria bacterium]|nr:hypothetical protein [Deltaproteobacteria bacterium]